MDRTTLDAGFFEAVGGDFCGSGRGVLRGELKS